MMPFEHNCDAKEFHLSVEAYSTCRFGSFVMLGVDFFRGVQLGCNLGLSTWLPASTKVLVVRPSSWWLPASMTRVVLVVRPLEMFLKWWMEAYHLYKTQLIKVINWNTTRGGGCLGSHIDEERSKLRYVVRFAELVSHRIFERKWRSWEILRARLFEGPFIRLNHLVLSCELWHNILLCQCWVVRRLAQWCVKSGHLKYRGRACCWWMFVRQIGGLAVDVGVVW